MFFILLRILSYVTCSSISQNEVLQKLIAQASEALDTMDDSWPDALDALTEGVCMLTAEKLIDEHVVPLHKELEIDLTTVSH